jgi:hypothetical protein
LILSLDGLEPEGASEQLWVVREVQADLTLVAGWLPRVNHETLRVLLEPVVALALPILATISDKEPCVVKSVQEVWPDVPHQWCQSHYLRHAAQPVYGQDAALKTELRKTMRQGLRQSLGEVLADAEASAFSPSTGDGLGHPG